MDSLLARFLHFWFVWTALVFVHETGHAFVARVQGQHVARISVGAGPVILRQELGDVDLVLRAVPIVGMTSLQETSATADVSISAWRSALLTLFGGITATAAAGLLMFALVRLRERHTRARWNWGRFVMADAAVLTVLNLLPLPPLDGGQAMLATLELMRGSALSSDARLWAQVGGFAVALVPMVLWTRWTVRIDTLTLRIGAPAHVHATATAS